MPISQPTRSGHKVITIHVLEKENTDIEAQLMLSLPSIISQKEHMRTPIK